MLPAPVDAAVLAAADQNHGVLGEVVATSPSTSRGDRWARRWSWRLAVHGGRHRRRPVHRDQRELAGSVEVEPADLDLAAAASGSWGGRHAPGRGPRRSPASDQRSSSRAGRRSRPAGIQEQQGRAILRTARLRSPSGSRGSWRSARRPPTLAVTSGSRQQDEFEDGFCRSGGGDCGTSADERLDALRRLASVR